MKISLKYVSIAMIITSLLTGFIYYRQEKVLLDESNLKTSYEEYLNLEAKEAKKKYGKLTIKNAKADLENFSIKECKDLKNNQYECVVEVKEVNIRGEHEYTQKLNVTNKDSHYQITQKTIFVIKRLT